MKIVTVSYVFIIYAFIAFGHLLEPPGKPDPLPAVAQEPKTIPAVSSTDTACRVYLTMDDGPSRASNAINRLILQDSFKINLFLIGNRVHGSPGYEPELEQYRQNPFIEISNHSYSHAMARFRDYYRDPIHVAADIARNAESLHLQQGIARLPGRNTWRIQHRKATDLADANEAADLLQQQGYRVFGWDLEWHYQADGSPSIPADSLMLRITRLAGNRKTFSAGHIVLLCHEYMFTTAENLLQLQLLVAAIRNDQRFKLAWLSSYPSD